MENMVYVFAAILCAALVALIILLALKDKRIEEIVKLAVGGVANSFPPETVKLLETVGGAGMNFAGKSPTPVDDNGIKLLLMALGFEVMGDAATGYVVKRKGETPPTASGSTAG
jgi:hypothetical protein